MRLNRDDAEYYIIKIQCQLKCTTLVALCMYNKAVQLSKENNTLIRDEVLKIIENEKGGVKSDSFID